MANNAPSGPRILLNHGGIEVKDDFEEVLFFYDFKFDSS